MRRANKRDDAEAAIVTALVRCGCLVERIDGMPFDLLVLRAGRVFMLEVKSSAAQARRKGATADRQAKFRRAGWPARVVLSPADAMRAVGFSDWRAIATRNGDATEARIAAEVKRLQEGR